MVLHMQVFQDPVPNIMLFGHPLSVLSVDIWSANRSCSYLMGCEENSTSTKAVLKVYY